MVFSKKNSADKPKSQVDKQGTKAEIILKEK